MRTFLKLIQAFDEIAAFILNHFNKLEERKIELIKEKKLSDPKMWELLELQKSIREIKAILNSENSLQDQLTQFELFLKNRWERIRKTSLAYPYAANLALSQLCHGLAKLLKSKAKESDQRCIFQFLMPTLKGITYEGCEDQLTGVIDGIPMGCFILDEEDAYPIPLEILLKNIGNEVVPAYFIWKKTQCVEYKKEAALYNGYTEKVLKDAELTSLIHFTKEGRALDEACDNYLAIAKLPGGTMRQQLTRLKEALEASGVRGDGDEENAHESINDAIIHFQLFLNHLSDKERKALFELRVYEMFQASQNVETFQTIWNNLTKFEKEKKSLIQLCTNENSLKMQSLLANRENIAFLDGEIEKAQLQHKADCKFQECLKVFAERCFDASKSEALSMPYDELKREKCVLDLLKEFSENANFFETRPLLLRGFLETVVLKIEKNCDAKTIHQKEMSTQIFLIRSAFEMDIILSDSVIASFFHEKNPISKDILDIFIQNNIAWNIIDFIEENQNENGNENGNTSLLYYLIKRGCCHGIFHAIKGVNPDIIHSKNKQGHTVLYQAIANKDFETANFALTLGADPNIKDDVDGCFPLHLLLSNSDEVFLYLLIRYGAKVNLRNSEGGTALIEYSKAGASALVLGILKNENIDLEVCENGGFTALMAAAENNELEIVSALLKRGADYVNADGDLAIDCAIDNKQWKAAEFILDAMLASAVDEPESPDEDMDVDNAESAEGAPEASDSDPQTGLGLDWDICLEKWLFTLVKANQISMVKKILKYPLDFNLVPLITHSIKAGYPEILIFLLERNKNKKLFLTEKQLSPLQLAAEYNQSKVVLELIKYGESIDQEIGYEQTIRDWAIQNQYHDVLKCIDEKIYHQLIKAIDRDDINTVMQFSTRYLNPENKNASNIIQILSAIEETYSLDNLLVTKEGIQSAICNENNYYTAEWMNLVCFQFRHQFIKMYPATTREQFKSEYIQIIQNQIEPFAFIPLNAPYDENHDDLSLNHWQVLIINREEKQIFYIDPATPSRMRFSMINFFKSHPFFKQFSFTGICADLQVTEENENWIRHCAVYVVEKIRFFYANINNGKKNFVFVKDYASTGLASIIALQSSLPQSVRDALFRLDCWTTVFFDTNTFKNLIPHLHSNHPLMLRQQHNEQVRNLMKLTLNSARKRILSDFDGSLLKKVIEMGRVKIMQVLLSSGLNPNTCVENEALINLAIQSRKREMVRTLLDKGADPNPNEFMRPVELAAMQLFNCKKEEESNVLGIMRDLIDMGARCEMKDFDFLTPEEQAVIGQYIAGNQNKKVNAVFTSVSSMEETNTNNFSSARSGLFSSSSSSSSASMNSEMPVEGSRKRKAPELNQDGKSEIDEPLTKKPKTGV